MHNALRLLAMAGFVLTLVGAGFVVIYSSLVEGSYEAEIRAQPWEWVLAASLLGSVGAAVAIGGLAACSRRAVYAGTLAQGVAVVVVLVLASPNLDSPRSDFGQRFGAMATLVLLFDAVVLLVAVTLGHRSEAR